MNGVGLPPIWLYCNGYFVIYVFISLLLIYFFISNTTQVEIIFADNKIAYNVGSKII